MTMHIVRVICCNDGCANLLGDLKQLRVGLGLGSETMILNLDKQIVFAEDFLQTSGLDLGVLVIVL